MRTQSIQQSKIEAIAERIYRTGETPNPGTEITWLVPSAYRHGDTVQCSGEVTAPEVAEAEIRAEIWQNTTAMQKDGVSPFARAGIKTTE